MCLPGVRPEYDIFQVTFTKSCSGATGQYNSMIWAGTFIRVKECATIWQSFICLRGFQNSWAIFAIDRNLEEILEGVQQEFFALDISRYLGPRWGSRHGYVRSIRPFCLNLSRRFVSDGNFQQGLPVAIHEVISLTRISVWVDSWYSLSTLHKKCILDRDLNDKENTEMYRFSH